LYGRKEGEISRESVTMSSISAIPLLLSVLIGLLLGLLAWGLLRIRHRTDGDAVMESRDDVLLGLLALGAFALGAFVTCLLLIGHSL
jgi:hypothetical protein